MQDLLFVPQRRAMSIGLARLDELSLSDVFEVRSLVMKTVPMFMRDACRAVVKASLEEIQSGQHIVSEVVPMRGWRLFFPLAKNSVVSTSQRMMDPSQKI